MIGQLLRGFRAGEEKLLWHLTAVEAAPESIVLRSHAFTANGAIPKRFAGFGIGDNTSPELSWSGVPAQAVELVLVMEDADAPLPLPFVHAIVTGISPSTTAFAEGALSSPKALTFGRNTIGRTAYMGPRAIAGHGPHTYSFQLFALNHALVFSGAPKRSAIAAALATSVIARGRLNAIFER